MRPSVHVRACMQFIDQMMKDPALSKHLTKPSISYGAMPLYAHGVFEADTKANLTKRMSELVSDDNAMLTVNDKKLSAPLRVRLRYANGMQQS